MPSCSKTNWGDDGDEAAGSLSVWVCESSEDADEALDLAKANAAGLRVWCVLEVLVSRL